MTTTDPAKAMAREIADLRRQVSALSRGTQASRTSLQVDGETLTLPQVVGLGQQAKVDAATARRQAQEATVAAQGAATTAEQAEAAALEAAGIAADKGRIVFTTSEPDGDETTLWIRPPSNIPYRWDGDSWEPVESASIKAAADAAVSAEAAADAAREAAQQAQNVASSASGLATTALTTAQGKNTVTYSESAPTAATPGIREGDIWYQRLLTGTQAGVIMGTWEWNGTAWVSRTFGDAVLTSLTAGKIVSGTMSADVAISGRFSTFFSPTSGWRELNSVGFQAFDPSHNLTISLDGVNNLLTGRYRTSISGRRIEMGSAGALSQIDFWAPSGNRTFIRSYTEADGKEAIQIGYGDPTQNGLDGRLNINTAGWYTSRFTRTDIVVGEYYNLFGAAVDIGQLWMSYTAASKQLVWQNISDEGKTATGTYTHRSDKGFQWMVKPSATSDVHLNFTQTGALILNYGSDAYFGGRIELREASQAFTTSPKVVMVTNENYAAYMRLNAGAGWSEIEFRTWDDTFGTNARAQLFINNSDGTSKENVVTADVDFLAAITGTKVRKYKRKRPATLPDGKPLPKDTPPAPEEVGLIAQEAPPQIVNAASTGELGIDLYQMNTFSWGAIQQLAARVEALEGKSPKPGKPAQ